MLTPLASESTGLSVAVYSQARLGWPAGDRPWLLAATCHTQKQRRSLSPTANVTPSEAEPRTDRTKQAERHWRAKGEGCSQTKSRKRGLKFLTLLPLPQDVIPGPAKACNGSLFVFLKENEPSRPERAMMSLTFCKNIRPRRCSCK